MKKYIENKGFIPREYINEKKKKEVNRNNTLILFLLIINFIALPKSIDIINDYLNNSKSVKVLSTNVEVIANKEDSLINVLEDLDEDIISASFSNNSGTIEVKNKDSLYYIEENSNFKINSIKRGNGGSYVVEVSI